MYKKIFLLAMFCLLLITTLYTFATAPMSRITSNIWRVGYGMQFATIQEAIDYPDVRDGDVIEVRYNAIPYYENVTVYKSVTIKVDESDRLTGLMPVVDGGNKKGVVFYVNVTNVEIDGFRVRNGYYGIQLLDNGSSICNNNVYSNERGISIESSSASNVVYNNTVSSNGCGIYLNGSYNTFLENRMSQNQFSLAIETFGVVHENYVQNIDTSNTVNNKPVYYLINQTDMKIPDNAGFVAIVNSTRITVENLTLQNNSPELLTAYSSEIFVKDLKINGSGDGILFQGVTNSTVENATLLNVENGMLLISSNESMIRGNEIITTGIGIHLGNSFSNTIAANAVSAGYTGMSQTSSAYNTIVDNIISNTNWAFELQSSNRSTIFHNNIINASYPLVGGNSSEIHFDNGYEGNYWSDYRQKQANASEIDHFGIWDTPYSVSISQNIKDNYPLVNPWSACRTLDQPMMTGAGQKLFTFSNSTIGSLSFNRRSVIQITLRATSGYDGFLNVTIPRNWTDYPFSITIDGAPIEHVCTLNATYSSLYLNYSAGRHTIIITGTELGSFQGDINHDGIVDIFDIVMVATNFGAEEE